jgi:hypothetical protein
MYTPVWFLSRVSSSDRGGGEGADWEVLSELDEEDEVVVGVMIGFMAS